jgi:hypothetical protein
MSNMHATAVSRQSAAFRHRAGMIRPAGQTVSTTTLDANGNVVPPGTPGSTTYDANGNYVSSTPAAPGTPVPAPQANQYTLIAQGLGTTASTIQSVLQSQNQLQIAQLNAQNQQYLANLQAQLALSPNNPTVRGQILQSQLLSQQLAMQQSQSNNMTLLIGLGIVVFAGVYVFGGIMQGPARSSRSSRSSRSRSRSSRTTRTRR